MLNEEFPISDSVLLAGKKLTKKIFFYFWN